MNDLEYKKAMECFEADQSLRARVAMAVRRDRPHVRPLRRSVVLAAAAALTVGCMLSIAAGLPTQVYHFIGGGSVTLDPNSGTAYYDTLDVSAPIEADENGRLWLTADGQHIDITDRISEDTPYIYERTDPATGQKGYLVLGGTPDNLGWMEWIQMDGDWFWHAENCMVDLANSFSAGQAGGVSGGTFVAGIPGGERNDSAPAASGDVEYTTGTEHTADDIVRCSIEFRPWVKAANAKLAEMGIVTYEPQAN